jgi:hypothetical protein
VRTPIVWLLVEAALIFCVWLGTLLRGERPERYS